ncbi:MAG: hypothetical protein ACOC2L_02940 [Candidatus Sumerlaeota bacterium]
MDEESVMRGRRKSGKRSRNTCSRIGGYLMLLMLNGLSVMALKGLPGGSRIRHFSRTHYLPDHAGQTVLSARLGQGTR